MSDDIQRHLADGILELRIARPDKKNALTNAMYGALTAGLAEASADPAITAVLISGEGDAFCAGNDISGFLPANRTDAAMVFIRAIADFDKPIVAAVQGLAVGVGTTMLLHCDLVFAAPSARLQVPFVNLGLVPEAASSLLLPRLLGHQRASAMVLLGEVLDADAALAAGVVNRVVADGDLEATARALAATVAAKPPTAVRRAKALLKGNVAEVLARMDAEGVDFAAQLKSDECRDAIGAFFAKRAPDLTRAA